MTSSNYGWGHKSHYYYGDELDLLVSDQSKPIHCDNLVIHAPSKCTYCDEYGKVQQEYRASHNVNFTGEKDPSKRPCPAELERGDDCQVWQGNVPLTETQVNERNQSMVDWFAEWNQDKYYEDD